MSSEGIAAILFLAIAGMTHAQQAKVQCSAPGETWTEASSWCHADPKERWPIVASMQIVLDPVQAKYPGNEHIKPCGPTNHEGACVDPSMPHIVAHLYATKEPCEKREKVKCTQDQQYFAPIGKPVFEEVSREQ